MIQITLVSRAAWCGLTLFLIAFTANAANPGAKQIEWLEGRIDSGSGMIDAFDNTEDFAPLYANCLAAIAFAHAGEPEKARGILDAIENIFDNATAEGRSRSPGGLLFDRRLASDPFSTGNGNFRTGENAWVVIALNAYENLTLDDRYTTLAVGLLDSICTYRYDDPSSKTHGAFRWGPTSNTFATEFQIDIYAALQGRAELSGNTTHSQYAQDLRDYLLFAVDDPEWPFVEEDTGVWLPYDDPVFNGEPYSEAHGARVYLDNQAWGVLALYPPQVGEVHFWRVLDSIDEGGGWDILRRNVTCESASVTGFTDEVTTVSAATDWVWLEGTEIAALAFRLVGDRAAATYYHGQVGQLEKPDGSVYHSCSNDDTYPNGTWPQNYRFPAATTTCWRYFVKVGLNPFQPLYEMRQSSCFVIH